MEKNNIKFVQGAVAGVALGVAASLFLTSKTGKKLRKDFSNTMADFYKHIAPQIKKIEKMGEKEYKEFMDNAIDQYGKVKKVSKVLIKKLKVEAGKSWDHFSEYLQESPKK